MQVATPAADTSTYLGPGHVQEVAGGELWVRLEDDSLVQVEPAFTFPYQPQSDDVLLVIGRDDRHYAIGVLAGSGQPSLDFPGDVDVRAVGGTLNLRGDKGVSIDAPRLTLRARLLRTFAESVSERAETTFRWVQDLLTVRAGESRRTVHGEDYSQSKRSVTLAEGVAKIDGRSVQLGH